MSLLSRIVYNKFSQKVLSRLPSWLLTPLYIIYRIKGAYFQDGLLTVHNSDFRTDPKFIQAYQLSKSTGGIGNSDIMWRVYVCCWAAWKVKDQDGDFVECGVNLGAISRAVIDYTDFQTLGKTFWLLDTFNGLIDDLISDEEKSTGIKSGQYDECYNKVKSTFNHIQGVRLVRGIVPNTLEQVSSEKISYLSIDMNCVAPEIAAIEFFWDKLISGAVVILDDYGWAKHINQKIAFDNFAEKHNVQVLSLPTGQGMIFKP